MQEIHGDHDNYDIEKMKAGEDEATLEEILMQEH